MNSEKYIELKELVLKDQPQLPSLLVEDYSKAQCRFTTAKFLIVLKKQKEALELLLTIDEKDMKEVEMWVWVLNEIGTCYQNENNGKGKALEYFKKADRIAFSSKKKFLYHGRGKYWVNVLYALQELKRKDELEEEIKIKIDLLYNQQDQYKYNSYLYEAYLFLAINEVDINMALEQLYKAMEFFPLKECGNEEKFKILWEKKEDSLVETFENILKLTHCHVCWDL
ncbi:hypothetical protein [Clostridium estertheticum]|uniref:hypothetical protein n=1 Tax=Clostridium estertheticum TaxID=238834 RepID=UPI001C7CD7D5|nr:hypothetical protein [Clostridium estertheticum]MBX4263127.1 hypothetical protein [Clostridium estertheticum]WLC89440.1 hypothetical protein KTC95_04255 [Clostridium estertheticum]